LCYLATIIVSFVVVTDNETILTNGFHSSFFLTNSWYKDVSLSSDERHLCVCPCINPIKVTPINEVAASTLTKLQPRHWRLPKLQLRSLWNFLFKTEFSKKTSVSIANNKILWSLTKPSNPIHVVRQKGFRTTGEL
jgi:hypothetical protein